ncbi:MAG: response regulator [Gammaproteobacteria bacterium]|nr:response regulator [Gammaproteobacteria bacterium]MBT3488216.1 response regulator [Gammaproteobacteria bacterium]MBT3719017.1 response regulator [Gammaproteobacteria bacterium]MBT3843871.1 response regulator [Gammaproteobacteria bacterium]MBT3892433.1 response regulator [Gammaproteobacteria bacterium]
MKRVENFNEEQQKWRILAIDDESAVHETYDAIFESKMDSELDELDLLLGGPGPEESEFAMFALEHAMSGKEGLQKIVEAIDVNNPFAVIYLDMRMPMGWDGLETAQHIREIDQEVRIILITAYMDHSLTDIRKKIGVKFEFLSKPVDSNELLQLTLSLATSWSQGRTLELALERAEAASKVKDDFLASMSHELRTPLTSILGNSKLMSGTRLSADQKSLMETIDISGRGLLALINDILDLSKIEAGKFVVEQTDYDFNLLVDEMEKTFSAVAKESSLQFRIQVEKPFEQQFIGDGRRVSQVMINLLSNAFKFTDKGGITLSVWVNEQLHFSVEDSGIGMSPEVLDRLFKPFEQADQTISRRYGGTGLGLHISWSLVELMGGSIDVHSIEDIGTKFEVILPCRLSDVKVAEHKEETSLLMSSYFKGRVLVAEDIEELQILVRRMLEMVGVEVTLANNGKEAVELALMQPYDLVLMDMQMPEMDGIEATGLLRQVGFEVPIVALTANVMQQHREQFEEAGCTEFLSKPIDYEALMKVLDSYLQPSDGAVSTINQEVAVAEIVDDELMQLFVERSAVHLERLKEALEKEDWASVRSAAHTVKGSGSTFGHPELTQLGKEVCDHIDHQRLNEVPELVKQLILEMAAL